jgi:uncharacterized BrkB/YihY/UPF0761 family membrane protein
LKLSPTSHSEALILVEFAGGTGISIAEASVSCDVGSLGGAITVATLPLGLMFNFLPTHLLHSNDVLRAALMTAIVFGAGKLLIVLSL